MAGSLFTVNAPDPLSGITAMFQFLATPAGQNVVEDFRVANKNIIGWIGDLIGVVRHHHQSEVPAQAQPLIVPAVTIPVIPVGPAPPK